MLAGVSKPTPLFYVAAQPYGVLDVMDTCELTPLMQSPNGLTRLASEFDSGVMIPPTSRESWKARPWRVVVKTVRFGATGTLLRPRRRDQGGGPFARSIDVVLATALLIFLSPVLAVISLAILCTESGPVLFAHKRLGRFGRTFNCLKFRSMVVDSDRRLQELLATDPSAREEWDRDHKLRNDPRVTRLGNFLRRSSLDELPQLLNVLRGDMSLVGPRPIVATEVHRYGRYIQHYYQIRPGITGLWQVSGRSDVSYRRRVAMDVIYARQKTATLNLRILLMTLPSVMKSKGAF